MKLSILINMEYDQTVAIKKTMYKKDVGTTTYSVAQACQIYLQIIERDGNNENAKKFVSGLVELK